MRNFTIHHEAVFRSQFIVTAASAIEACAAAHRSICVEQSARWEGDPAGSGISGYQSTAQAEVLNSVPIVVTEPELNGKDVEYYIDLAEQHSEDHDWPDHEVGDLQTFLRTAWGIMTPAQRALFRNSHEVTEIVDLVEAEEA